MRKPRCFTLIELLVVVAIIAVLASLLLPALTRAKMMVKNTNCQNHLRQMALGVAMYAGDQDDWMPQTRRHSSEWLIGIAEYCGYSGDTSLLGDTATVTDAVDRKVKIFLCPETKSWYFRWGTGRNYGYNIIISTGRPDLPNYSPRRRFSTVAWPERTWLISDNYHYTPIDMGYHTASIRTPEESGNPDLRTSKHHQRTLNFVYLDGHTENLYQGKRKDICQADKAVAGW
jgi:prepilin-type N-terminal cleavage/methylation domain-containing protein/prepilin-type processing-associated H-X9-DG protein